MVPVRIFGIACSPRHGNTEILVNEALKAAREIPGVETEFYSIVGKRILPCNSCYRCVNAPREDPCPAIKDDFKDVYPRFFAADGLLVGVPVYCQDVTAQFAAIRDRLVMISELGPLGTFGLRNKPIGAITVAWDRNAGQESVIYSIHRFALICDMLPVSVGPERSPEFGIGAYSGCAGVQFYHPFAPTPDVIGGVDRMNSKAEREVIMKDKASMNAARMIGFRVAELSKVIKAGFSTVPKEEQKWGLGPISIPHD